MIPKDVVESALGCTREEIENLSDAELFVLCDAVSAVSGVEIAKDEDREVAVSNAMAEDLEDEYVAAVDEAAALGLPTLPAEDVSPDEVAVMLERMGERIDADLDGDRGDRMRETILGSLLALTLMGRTRGRNAVAATGRPVDGVSRTLTSADEAAVATLSDQQLWWIGDFWGNHLSKTISATVTREAVVAGLGREDVGRILRGVVAGTQPAVRVPGTFAGGAEPYFRALAGTVRNQASNRGALSAFGEAGVKRYRIVAVLDKRTSEICNFMHGRTFAVRTGQRLSADLLEAETPDEVREISPWRSAESAKTIAGTENQEDALARAGMALPPYHGSCRTTIAPE